MIASDSAAALSLVALRPSSRARLGRRSRWSWRQPHSRWCCRAPGELPKAWRRREVLLRSRGIRVSAATYIRYGVIVTLPALAAGAVGLLVTTR